MVSSILTCIFPRPNQTQSVAWTNLKAVRLRTVGELFKGSVAPDWGWRCEGSTTPTSSHEAQCRLEPSGTLMITHITYNTKAVQTSDIDYNLTVSGNKCFPTSPYEERCWVNQEKKVCMWGNANFKSYYYAIMCPNWYLHSVCASNEILIRVNYTH